MTENNNNTKQTDIIVNNNEIQNVIDISIEDEMKSCYLAYAMSVIVSRAIPDARDGLKPVHRRIIHAMNSMGCGYNRQHKKSARIVGEVMGKYHPHGDTAIYDALVRMAQDFSMGCKLIDGQGNFGSVDNDPPAAMRYTEARLTKISHTMLDDLDNNTVVFKDNYDGTETEPSVLPASFPNLLINGSEGIAVGMATSIPTHNLTEVLEACLAYINNPSISDAELIQIVPGPDFPTGGIIMSKYIANQAMLTGRGSIPIRSRTHIEEIKGGKEAIVITELPYQVVKANLITKIAELVKDKRIEGISNIRDESNKKGIRVVIDIKKDHSTDIVLNHLYKLTDLQSSFAVNMLALNNNKPELLNLKAIIKIFIDFRKEIVTNRTLFLLNQSRDRAHLVIGFCVVVDYIDKVIAIIRGSANVQEASEKLLSEKWPATSVVKELIVLVSDKRNNINEDGEFKFTEAQVKAILEMRLSRLTGMERENLIKEIEALSVAISEYISVLKSKEKLMNIIYTEIEKIKEEYHTPRKTEIIEGELGEVSMEDFIEKKDVLISISVNGYVKRTDVSQYTAQRRGGKGKIGMSTQEDDSVSKIFTATTHSPILFFTTQGKVYRLKAYQIPETAPNTKGRAVVNLIKVLPNEKISAVMPLPCDKEEWRNFDLVFATKKGNVRRSAIADFENINTNGKIAISLDDDDVLIDVKLARPDDNVLLASKDGNAMRFALSDLRIIKSRSSDGVRGMNLDKKDEVVSLCILSENENNPEIKNQYLMLDTDLRMQIKKQEISNLELEMKLSEIRQSNENFKLTLDQVVDLAKFEQMLLTVTEKGYGKRTSAYEYRITGRGGKGIININTEGRNGGVVATAVAENEDEIILIGTKGKTLRTDAGSISIIGRNTRGVRIVNLENGELIASVSIF